jgi:CelD/BcsL family acetyltransferase involved in cellulose biosynthesis
VQIKPLQTSRIHSASDLDAFRDAWRDLAADAPMRSPEWLLEWWRYYAAPDDELCVLLFHEPGGPLVGLAPIYIQSVGKRATVRLLGSGDACTNHTTWLAAAGWETRVGVEVAHFLLDYKPGWDRVLFESVDADDLAINTTVASLVENGCLLRKTPLLNCWKITLPSTWDDYLMMLSRTHRNRCRKQQREFFESGRVQLRQVISEADFSEGFEIMLKLHAARWGEATKPEGVFSDQRFRAFHETVARELLARKQLRLAWLECDGEPVAVEYQFVDEKAVYAYQAGMDPSVSEFPAGNLSIMAAIQFAIAQGCESFDLSRGDEPYKANWRATPTACHDIRIWPDRISGRMEHAVWGARNLAARVRKQAEQWLKARIPRPLIDAGLRMLHVADGKRRLPPS